MVKQKKDKKHDDLSASKGSRKSSLDVKDLTTSPLIKLKQHNQKVLEKSCKAMDQAVKERVDLKQAQLAVKALQQYFKMKSKLSVSGKKNLFTDEEDGFIQLSFTLTQLPARPSPRPV